MAVSNGVDGVHKSTQAPRLSNRGAHILSVAGQGTTFMRSTFGDAYDAQANPAGFINLNAAQNTLQQAELLGFLRPRFDLRDVDFTFGDDVSGSRRLNRALAGFFNRHFAPLETVTPDDLVVSAGCGQMDELLLHQIADPGEGVLIPTPMFSGYKSDLETRNHITPIPVAVDINDAFSPAAIPALEAALLKAQSAGTPVRGVILCNPHNPLGQCYPRETIVAYARFCEAHDLHLVCDEIFAFSTFASADVPNAPPFVSALSIDLLAEAGCSPARVHVMYGLSKDFNANGLRGGVLVSPANADLLTAVRAMSYYVKISSATAVLWSLILEDDVFWAGWVAENQRRLAEAYRLATDWLKFHHVPYIPAFAGHFVSVNFRQFFPSEDSEGKALETDVAKERALSGTLVANKILLGSWASFSYPEPGWYRLCFSMPREPIIVAFRRLEKAFGLPEWQSTDTKGIEK